MEKERRREEKEKERKRKGKEGKANVLHKLKTFSFSLFETFEGMRMRERISSIRTEERKGRERRRNACDMN